MGIPAQAVCGGIRAADVLEPSDRRAMLGLVIIVFDAELWLWEARRGDSWTFVTLPGEASAEIRDLTGGRRRGFGSVRVRAAIGGVAWMTSIFPDSVRNAYVLPIKRAVRTAVAVDAGDVATVKVELIDP
jgi:hypothetical protein